MGVHVCCFVAARLWKCSSCHPGHGRGRDSSNWHFQGMCHPLRARGGGQEITVKLIFTMYSELWESMLGQRWPRGAQKTMRMRKACKPLWANCLVAILDSPLKTIESPDRQIQGLCHQGQLHEALAALSRLDQQGALPTLEVYTSLLKACSQKRFLAGAKQVHASLVKHGLESQGCLGEYVVSTLVKCNCLEDALPLFHRLLHRTVVSWTAVISGYTKAGQCGEALRMYACMQVEGIRPGKYAFVSLLQACGNLGSLDRARQIHAEVLKHGFENDLFVGTCVVHMYVQCGSMEDARPVFDRLPHRDVVLWNAILAGYAQHGLGQQALQIFREMQQEGVCPNDRTYVSALQACSSLAEAAEPVPALGQSLRVCALQLGKAIHFEAWRRGYESDLFVGSSLVRMYGKCGSLMDAEHVFQTLPQHDVVSWNALLAGYVDQGLGLEAVNLYQQLREAGVAADIRTFVTIIQACSSLGEREPIVSLAGECVQFHALQMGKAVHSEIQRKGFEAQRFLGNALVSMYGKCGSIKDAQCVFGSLSPRETVSWNLMLAGHVQQGQDEEALHLYQQMQEEGSDPDDRTFVSALQACGSLADKEAYVSVHGLELKLESLKRGRAMHDEAWRRGNRSSTFVNNALVIMYGKCGSTLDARHLFDELPERNIVPWNAMLATYAQQHQAEHAFELYSEMQEQSISPDGRTFATLVQACGLLADNEPGIFIKGLLVKGTSLQSGKELHAEALRRGDIWDVFVGNALVSMYGKCGSIVDAQNVFGEFPGRNGVTWNTMFATYSQQGLADKALELYMEMLQEGVSPDARSFVTLIQACALLAEKDEGVNIDGYLVKVSSLQMGKFVHAEAQRVGFRSDVFIESALISMYGKSGSILDAENVFGALANRVGMSWNAMLAGYAQQGQGANALQTYCDMQEGGVEPDVWTTVSLLQACGVLAEQEELVFEDELGLKADCLRMGKVIHAEALNRRFESDLFLSNALVSLYGKCGSIVDALLVFERSPKQNVVSWNVILTSCTQQNEPEKALSLYQRLLEECVDTDDWTFVTVVQACGMLAEEAHKDQIGVFRKSQSLWLGKALHAEACRRGHIPYSYLGNALITMYGKCGSIIDAEFVFDQLSSRDVVTWNAMLATYSQHEREDRTLQLFQQMQMEGTSPDETTLILLLQACGNTGALDICLKIHHNLTSTGRVLSVLLANTFIHVYGKCAKMEYAHDVFRSLGQPDVVSWNALIAGHARQGNSHTSFLCFEKMQQAGVKPDSVTFLSVLSACSHAGLVDKGIEFFNDMTKSHGIAPRIEHYVGLIDLLGRAGHFSEIEELLTEMSLKANLPLWNCLLGACRKHGNLFLGKLAFERAVRLQPKQGAAYVLMFSLYANAGMWDSAIKVNKLREKATASKQPGQTWIEYMQQVHTFGVGSPKDSPKDLIFDALAELTSKLGV